MCVCFLFCFCFCFFLLWTAQPLQTERGEQVGKQSDRCTSDTQVERETETDKEINRQRHVLWR